MAKTIINEDSCKGCGLCVEACKKHLLRLSETKINDKGHHPVEQIDEEACTACGNCGIMCPDCVITVER